MLFICGRVDERACAIVGRKSCDDNLVEFDNRCLCAWRVGCNIQGQRRCLCGEPGSWKASTGCALNLVPQNNVCTPPNGRPVWRNRACAIVLCKSCDDNLVEFDNMCRVRGACGAEGQRRCLAGEPGAWHPPTGCAVGLSNESDVCIATGTTPKLARKAGPGSQIQLFGRYSYPNYQGWHCGSRLFQIVATSPSS